MIKGKSRLSAEAEELDGLDAVSHFLSSQPIVIRGLLLPIFILGGVSYLAATAVTWLYEGLVDGHAKIFYYRKDADLCFKRYHNLK